MRRCDIYTNSALAFLDFCGFIAGENIFWNRPRHRA